MVNFGPITLLEQALRKGVPYDARLKEEYLETHEVTLLDDPVLIEIANHFELKILAKIPAESTVVVGLYVPVNLSEYIKKILETETLPTDVTDPKTGKTYQASPNIPDIKKESFLSISFKLTDRFKLTFVALDNKGRALYYNILEGSSVDDLVSQALQELFGNTLLYGDTGFFLSGIWDLINGKKVKRIRGTNQKPDNFDLAFLKDHNPELALLNGTLWLAKATEIFLTYFVSLFLIGYGIIYQTGKGLLLFSNGKLLEGYLYYVLGSVVLTILCFIVSTKLNKFSKVLSLKSKFI